MRGIPRDWTRTVNDLRKKLPPPLPVEVRTVHKCEVLGHTEKLGDRFRIVVLRGCVECMYATLVHEWSHLFDWLEHEGHPEHSESWGVWYARAYNVVYGEQSE